MEGINDTAIEKKAVFDTALLIKKATEARRIIRNFLIENAGNNEAQVVKVLSGYGKAGDASIKESEEKELLEVIDEIVKAARFDFFQKAIGGESITSDTEKSFMLNKALHYIDDKKLGVLTSALQKLDGEVASAFGYLVFSFEDFLFLSDYEIREVLRKVDNQTLVYALLGAEAEVQNKFFRSMSERAVKMAKEDMEFMGRTDFPYLQKKIKESQNELIDLVL